ncbi:uncharacterized protein LOC123780677 isoform X2 [Ursus americanus]|nr:uncharacterized protein LOC123780677 isoform X2 [Ursus americanus]
MVFGLGCQRERLYKPLYVAHLFILAGVVYYYFQGSVGKPAPDHEIAGEPSQLVGETLRPVWGPTDKCYPVTTQRRRAKGGKKQASEAMPPKSGAAPKEETELWSQHEGEVRPPAKEAASPSPGPAAKAVAEEEEGAGTPGWEVGKPGAPTGLSPARALPRSPRTLRGRGEGSVWGGWGTCKTTGPKCLRSPSGARSRMGWRGSGHGVSGEWVRTLPPLTSPVCGRWHLSRPTTVGPDPASPDLPRLWKVASVSSHHCAPSLFPGEHKGPKGDCSIRF